jgi:choline-sulfatase
MTDVDIAAMRANYAGNVTLIDDEIGRILNALGDIGQISNTLIIFTSDHGEMNGDYGRIYKGSFLDPAIKVPLVVVSPGGGKLGRVNAGLVELMDVGNTLLDYGEAEPPLFSPRSRKVRLFA